MKLICEMDCLYRTDGECNRIQTTFGLLKNRMIGCKNFEPLTCDYCILYINKECVKQQRKCKKFKLSIGNDWIGFENNEICD